MSGSRVKFEIITSDLFVIRGRSGRAEHAVSVSVRRSGVTAFCSRACLLHRSD